MRCRWLGSGILLLVLGPALGAFDDKNQPNAADPREEYRAILQEYSKAQLEFSKVYREAKTDEERKAALEKRPNPAPLAKRMLAIAENNPKDSVALDALMWILRSAQGSKEMDQAVELLSKDHVTSPAISNVSRSLVYSTSPSAIKLLRAVLEKNPDKQAQGVACLALAQNLKNQAERTSRGSKELADKLNKQAEEYFERVLKDYADVKDPQGLLGDVAKNALHELRFLAIGKTAPEIEAEDLDGKSFKLSDYRGKVILLDFWGHW